MTGLLRSWLRGIVLLRHPDLVRDLGERHLKLERIQLLRNRFPTAKIDSEVILIGETDGKYMLGEEVSICRGSILSADRDDETMGIEIGARTWIGQYNNLRATGGKIAIGADCLISQFCTLIACNHKIDRQMRIQEQGLDHTRRGVTLGDDVWLGAGVAVLPGVTIGNGAVIGANAVVTRDIPEYEIWGGVPARRLGERT